MRLKLVLKAILITWVVLWVVFLVRQGKRGQYAELSHLYANEYGDRVKYLLGEDLSVLVDFSLSNIPRGSTYDIRGFERFSIKEVRVRYYLWPLYRTEKDPDFIIVYGPGKVQDAGYIELKTFSGNGSVYAREGAI